MCRRKATDLLDGRSVAECDVASVDSFMVAYFFAPSFLHKFSIHINELMSLGECRRNVPVFFV